jgi:hypothetical protein
VQDTIVRDPFFEHMPKHFGMTFKELLAAKHPSTWVQFERCRCPFGLLSRPVTVGTVHAVHVSCVLFACPGCTATHALLLPFLLDYNNN